MPTPKVQCFPKIGDFFIRHFLLIHQDAKKLVKMANDIGSFFESEPDRAAGVEGVANHIVRYWEPRMRKDLLAHLDATGGEGLRPLVLDAVKTNRARLTPKS